MPPPRQQSEQLDSVLLGRILERLDSLDEIRSDIKQCATKDDLVHIERRIEKCESFQTWAYRSLGMAGTAVFAGLAYFGQRFGKA